MFFPQEKNGNILVNILVKDQYISVFSFEGFPNTLGLNPFPEAVNNFVCSSYQILPLRWDRWDAQYYGSNYPHPFEPLPLKVPTSSYEIFLLSWLLKCCFKLPNLWRILTHTILKDGFQYTTCLEINIECPIMVDQIVVMATSSHFSLPSFAFVLYRAQFCCRQCLSDPAFLRLVFT